MTTIRDARRRAALERMADHVLEVGLRGASLRPLAAAAGTTNRMLLYYFADKDELIEATLRHVAGRLVTRLEAALGAPLPYAALLPRLWAALREPGTWPYMRLWLELAALSARGEEPYRTIAGEIGDGFLAWAGARLEVEREADRPALAALLLGTVDGLLMLDAVGRGAEAEAAVRCASGRSAPRRVRRGQAEEAGGTCATGPGVRSRGRGPRSGGPRGG